jgi:hypothetical protein
VTSYKPSATALRAVEERMAAYLMHLYPGTDWWPASDRPPTASLRTARIVGSTADLVENEVAAPSNTD